MRRAPEPEVPQALAVQARLVQDHPDVEAVAFMCGNGGPGVNQLTAATIYAACGCSLHKCRKVVREARSPLGGSPALIREHERWERSLLANALVLAKRTTPGRQRRQQKGQP